LENLKEDETGGPTQNTGHIIKSCISQTMASLTTVNSLVISYSFQVRNIILD